MSESNAPKQSRRVITAALLLAVLAAAMEATVVSTAMPTVIGQLHGIRMYPWVFTAYLVASTTTVPVYGKLADVLGRRPVFLFGMALFLIGSALSGAAQSMPQLIAFRAVQGLGAGGLMPVALTIIGDLYSFEERPRVQALTTTVWGAASLAGPVLGAVITMQMSWRWVFYINIPIGLLAAFVIGTRLRENVQRRQASIDYLGSLFLTGTIVLGLLAAEQSSVGEAGRAAFLAPVALALFGLFLWQERRAPDPMLPLALFRHPIIFASTIGNLLIGVMMFSMEAYMPLFMQGARGGTAASASQVLTPLILAWSLTAYAGAKVLVRFGLKATATIGAAMVVISTLLLVTMRIDTDIWVIRAAMFLMGCGLGPSSVAFLIAMQNSVDWHQRGVVTASAQFFRTIGGAVGVALLGITVTNRMAGALDTLSRSAGVTVTPNALLDQQTRLTLPAGLLAEAQQSLASALHTVYVALAVMALVGVVNVLILGRRDLGTAPATDPLPAMD